MRSVFYTIFRTFVTLRGQFRLWRGRCPTCKSSIGDSFLRVPGKCPICKNYRGELPATEATKRRWKKNFRAYLDVTRWLEDMDT